jgi:tetratricopeptide (TPR) repeat protein
MFSPTDFEDFCCNILESENGNQRIRQTRSSGDGGVDLYVDGEEVGASIFGSKMQGPTTVFIEAKRRKNVDIHDFARSIVTVCLNRKCNGFALITSAEFNISTYFEMAEICRQNRVAFVYIHRELLTRALIEHQGLAERWGIPSSIPGWNELVTQVPPDIGCRWTYQKVTSMGSCSEINPVRGDVQLTPNQEVRIPVVIENWGREAREVTIEITGRNHWHATRSSHPIVMIPGRAAIGERFTFSLTAAQRVRLPRIHVQTLDVSGNGQPNPIRVTIDAGELHARPYFQPTFVGVHAHANKMALRAFLDEQLAEPRDDERLGEWFSIEGAAGVGKSRIVEEALLKPIGGITHQSVPKIYRHFVQRGDNKKLILDILSHLYEVKRVGNETAKQAAKLIEKDGLTDSAIDAAAQAFSQRTREPVMIVLEDLHHGGEKVFKWLQAVFTKTKDRAPEGSTFRFCITGRNDNTFPNPRHGAFVEALRNHVEDRGLAQTRIITVQPLGDEDAKTLVDTIFNGITVEARNRILNLSENIPFNILQVIEYLCEERLVEINERSTYSIHHEDRFHTKLGIPKSMAQVLDLRIRNLKKQPSGKGLVSVLRCLCLLGLQSGWDTYEQLVKEMAPNGDPWLLFNTNYLTLDEGEVVRFSHENILNFLLPTQDYDTDWKNAASVLVNNETVLEELEDWRRCRVYEIAGEDSEVARIVTHTIGNGGVAELSRDTSLGEVYWILRMGVDLWRRRSDESDGALFLLNLYFLWAYASKFTRHYAATVTDASQALQAVRSQPRLEELVGSRAFNLACAKIEQIIGHAYQNIGNMDLSMAHVLNALTEARRWEIEESTHLDLLFDAEDRLRKNHIIRGELRHARRAFQAACSLAEQKKDNILLGTGQYGEAELYFVQDPDKAEAVWWDLKSRAGTHTDERIRITLDLALMQVKLLKSHEPEALRVCLDQLKNLGDRGLELGLVGPLPKVNLLCGYAYYKLGDLDRAIEQFFACYAKAEQSGYGVYMWFSQNNIALVQQRLDRPNSEKQVISAFTTALDKAEKQGFLKYLSIERPLFFQGALVDNALRYFENRSLLAHRQKLVDRLSRNGQELDKLPRANLAHSYFQEATGTMMMFI